MTNTKLTPVWFQNQGEIDPLTLITMGASIKDNDSPIGYFGTGLKFALATILRGGGRIEIYIGTKLYKAETVETNIRGKQFQMVYINGEKAGFTTELGRNWKNWMAYRELHSNTIDEPEAEIAHSSPPEPLSGNTQIRVWDENIQKEFYDRGKTFVQSEPLYKTKRLEVHAGSSQFLFYRGVKVGTLPAPSIHTYNILQGLTLTEDRTYDSVSEVRYLIEDEMCQSVCDEALIEPVLKAKKGMFENTFYYFDGVSGKTPAFLKCIDNIMSDISMDMKELPSSVVTFIEKQRGRMIEESHGIELDGDMDAMLKLSGDTIIAMGVPVTRHPVVVVETLGVGVMGQAKNGKAFIARAAFQNGQKYLTITLLEEWFHLTTGMQDHTRQMQDWLFNELVAMHERGAS